MLELGLRLGEGTGAVLAVPVVQAAAKILREMATFDSAGIEHADDASVSFVRSIEQRHLEVIPSGDAHGSVWRQAPFWFLGNFQPFTLAVGFLGPAMGLSGLWTSVAGITGIVFGALFMAAHAAQGPALGLPQMVQSRAQFGYRGVIVPVLATTLTFVGFNVVTLVIVKQGLAHIFGWNTSVVVVVASLVATIVAIYGHDWIHRVVLVVFWISIPLWLILTIGVVGGHAAGSGVLPSSFSWAAFFAMFAVAASYNITYAPCVADYSRYLARNTPRRYVTTAVAVGAAGSPMWLIPLGAWMATRLRVADALTGIDRAGNHTLAHVGTALVLVAVAALIAAMSISAYSGMLSVLTIIDSFRRVAPGRRARVGAVLGVSVVCLIGGIAFSNETTVINDWLLVMLYLLAPWTSVSLVDFYVVRRGRFAVADLLSPDGVYGRWACADFRPTPLGSRWRFPSFSCPAPGRVRAHTHWAGSTCRG